jgi:hypothetical protein
MLDLEHNQFRDKNIHIYRVIIGDILKENKLIISEIEETDSYISVFKLTFTVYYVKVNFDLLEP